jgi:hypothetical protein
MAATWLRRSTGDKSGAITSVDIQKPSNPPASEPASGGKLKFRFGLYMPKLRASARLNAENRDQETGYHDHVKIGMIGPLDADG